MDHIKKLYKDFGAFDLVVVGGGCTGVCAAVRAARQGLRVAIIEKNNCLGGVATSGLVNIWHSLFDVDGKEQIIGGVTDEVVRTLARDGYADLGKTPVTAIRFDPNAMKWALDQLVVGNGIRVFFHTFYSTLLMQENRITGILVSNKDGLGIIKADFFVDATGDGDLCRDAGLPAYRSSAVQPPSPGCFLKGRIRNDIGQLIRDHGAEFGLDDDWGWDDFIPGIEDVRFRADFHIFGKMCSKAEDLTAAEIEGRNKIYALQALLRKYDDPALSVVALSSHIGIRETVHYETRFRANEQDLLMGKGYADTVMRGTYRVDVHHHNDNGITFKYLTGSTVTYYGKSSQPIRGNWREEAGITTPYAPYYQVPFDILVQEQVDNLIPVGRMVNADEGAFGAIRVMVNLNQLGEAAGVAAWLSLQEGKPISGVSGEAVKRTLQAGGSLL